MRHTIYALPTTLDGESTTDYGIETAEIQQWRKQVGDSVAVGDILFDLDVEKSVLEIPSPVSGTLSEIILGDGEIIYDIKANGLTDDGAYFNISVGIIETDDGVAEESIEEQIPEIMDTPEPKEEPKDTEVKERDRWKPIIINNGEDIAEEDEVTGEGKEGDVPQEEKGTSGFPSPVGSVRASPSARRLANEHNIDLTTVKGSGPSGAITQGDVEALVGAHGGEEVVTLPPDKAQEKPADVSSDGTTVIKPSMMRRSIAETLDEGSRMPTAAGGMTFNFTILKWFRRQYREGFEKRYGVPLRAPFPLIAALVRVLKHEEFRLANAYWDENGGDPQICLYNTVNLGISYDDGSGLRIIVAHDAGETEQLARDLDDLFERAQRPNGLKPKNLKGMTFIFNNIGALGHEIGQSILVPGISAMLNMGRMQDSGEAQLMLFFDHRVFDGYFSGEFIKEVHRVMEEEIIPELIREIETSS